MIEEFAIPMSRSLAYLLEAFVLLWVAKFAYTAIYRRVELKVELFQRNNHAWRFQSPATSSELSSPSVGPSPGPPRDGNRMP